MYSIWNLLKRLPKWNLFTILALNCIKLRSRQFYFQRMTTNVRSTTQTTHPIWPWVLFKPVLTWWYVRVTEVYPQLSTTSFILSGQETKRNKTVFADMINVKYIHKWRQYLSYCCKDPIIFIICIKYNRWEFWPVNVHRYTLGFWKWFRWI